MAGRDTREGRKLLDTDGDRLDDRLVAPSAEKADMRTISKRVRNLTLSNLPPQLLERMLDDVADQRQSNLEEAQEYERDLHARLIEGDTRSLSMTRRKIRKCAREDEVLERQRGKIFNALQERVVADGMAKLLGGAGRAAFLEYAILALIVFVLGLLSYEMAVPTMSKEQHVLFGHIDLVCCCIFLVEFFVRLSRARDKKWFWKNNWIDFVTSIPVPTLEVIRYGRALRLVRLFRLLRLVRALKIVMKLWHGMEKLEDVLDMKMMKKSIKWLAVIMVLGAVAIQFLEGTENKPVGSAFESLWWSFTTVVTGGFGDIHNPVGATGRVLTVLLIVSGMIVVGVFTATLTSVYMADETEAMEIQQDEMESRIEALMAAHEEAREERLAIRQALGIVKSAPQSGDDA